MSARKIQVSVECCDVSTGEMQLTVEDPGNQDADFAYQDMVLHPAVCSLLHELLGWYVKEGISSTKSVSLNVPAVESA